MKHATTQGIVLRRTNFGEAGRIVVFLTPDHGKISVLARGVRKTKSKLAGGIELFSVSDISYIIGRGEVFTLTSSRVLKHFGRIAKDLARSDAAYEFIKAANKNTEDQPEPGYFRLLQEAFAALDEPSVDVDLVKLWFSSQLLKLAGHTPNLQTDQRGVKLTEGKAYLFDFDTMAFRPDGEHNNSFKADHIKFLRLLFGNNSPAALQKVQGTDKLAKKIQPLLQSILQTHLRI